MRKSVFFILFMVIIINTTSAQSNVTGVVTNNGIGLIPAFNLNNPAALVFAKLNISKHIEFSPDFAINIKDGKPWFGDLWLRYNQSLDTSNRWIATVGFDYSPYFQPFEKNGEEVTQCVIYLAYQAKMKFVQNKKNTFVLDYWYNCTVKRDIPYGIKGSYLSLTYSREEPLKKFTLFGNVNTFFISFSDKSKGIGVSYDASLAHKKSGLFIGTQLVHSVSPRSSTNMKINWSISLGINRNLL